MNDMEERLWNYIDGNCSADEQKAIDILIVQDEAYRIKYKELLSLNTELLKIEPDEPSMAFTFKVMEGVRTMHTLKPLNAVINQRVVRAIAGFFVITILLLLIYILSSLHLTFAHVSVQLPGTFKIPDISNYINGPVIKGFLFFDIVLALFLFDSLLRKRGISKQL